MSFCTACLYPQNPDSAKFCLKCGKPLLLKERYHPLYPIGQGGFGRTFLAVDEHIPSRPFCVIKQLCFPDADTSSFGKAAELFRQEAVRLDELRHPQIPQLLAHFEQGNQLYLVQELITGQTLAQELQQQGVFSEAHIWQLLQDLLPVLQFIHSRQVIHRDIKPANIMRKRTPENLGSIDIAVPQQISETAIFNKGSTMTLGNMESLFRKPKRGKAVPNSQIQPANTIELSTPGNLVLIDFGVAKQITATALVNTGTTVGSAEYMAPEQMRGKALPASDLYSLGVSCIYLLTGISPFDLFDVTSDRWVWRDYLLPGNTVTENLSAILDKLLQNALPQRYQSATEVLAAINTKAPIKQSLVNTLYSAAGVDYKRLRNLLATKQWQQADQETWTVMCQALSKPSGSYLFNSDLENLPCGDLQIIDQLWRKYSQGHFGFTVQTQIYLSCGSDYGQFCATVGWSLTKSNSPTHNFLFIWSVPKGNLPSHSWAGGTQLWRHMNVLTTKLLSNS